MTLERVTEADLEEVVALINLAYRGSGGGWATERQYIEGERTTVPLLRADLEATPEAHLLMWREKADGALLGSVWLEPSENGAWYLGLLSVRPDMQQRQLGRRLLGAAEEFAKQQGARRIRMTVIQVRDKLIAWYERRGYRLTAERAPFPYGDERFGRPLRDDLEFVMLEKAI